ncbi:MAG: hypothetical protein E7289_02765 [Lachnospiraceae bacterium]|nr:hypothetical protein [Lachnospiraceae bacterium]
MSNVIIEAKGITKQYMDHKVVNDADFQIKEGQIVGLIGPNGATMLVAHRSKKYYLIQFALCI